MVHSSMTEKAKIYSGGKTVSLISGAGKTGQLRPKNEPGSLPHTIHKKLSGLKTKMRDVKPLNP